ncbi:heme-binding-like protein [Scenedesmus sp. PABB004]|nr:heme-binding-like protein [Scenedesmus sp. PABB004]
MEAWAKALVVVGSVVGGAAVLWPVGIWWEVSKCEKPKYSVIRPLGSKRSWWSGQSPAELRQAIANFIFGNNSPPGAAPGASGEKIAMTSPVVMQAGGGKGRKAPGSQAIAMTSPVVMDMAGTEALPADAAGDVRMSFVMPSKFTAATLPKPNNPDVRVREVPGHTAAVLRWRGHVRDRRVVEEKKRELLALLAAEGLSPAGELRLYQYFPPFTYGWQRVNEVVFEVKA